MIAAACKADGRVGRAECLTDHYGLSPWVAGSELARLRWDQIDLKAGAFHVARCKNGSPSTHPLRGPELRALLSWKRQQDAGSALRVYVAERRSADDSHDSFRSCSGG
jgi:type 1 fimbriae regulatory protein FimB/type 1 fimbriae regulatory protein FimE